MYNGFSHVGALALAPALQHLTGLRLLCVSMHVLLALVAIVVHTRHACSNLSVNELISEGAAALAPALQQLTRLHEL